MKCGKCGHETEKAYISAATGGKLCVSSPENKTKLGGMKSSDINVCVCPECGYIELYAADTTIFGEKSEN